MILKRSCFKSSLRFFLIGQRDMVELSTELTDLTQAIVFGFSPMLIFFFMLSLHPLPLIGAKFIFPLTFLFLHHLQPFSGDQTDLHFLIGIIYCNYSGPSVTTTMLFQAFCSTSSTFLSRDMFQVVWLLKLPNSTFIICH